MDELTIRPATMADLPAIAAVMERAIAELQKPFLDEAQIGASRRSMGLDTTLVADGTYLCVWDMNTLAGCGGWSRRATLYGGDHSAGTRDDRLLDPAGEPARVRAMYTDPAYVRRGIGRMILEACETAARNEGFTRLEMMATAAGEPLYIACGYQVIARADRLAPDGVAVPGAVMAKDLA
ncbi:GNAT family N-acetyltransferase [Tsuneonella sp. HG249]